MTNVAFASPIDIMSDVHCTMEEIAHLTEVYAPPGDIHPLLVQWVNVRWI
jgi:hypothetical protein